MILLRQCLFGLCVVLAMVINTMAQGSESSVDRDGDRKLIEALLEQWEEAWNKHDMVALAALFHEDAIWVLWTGEVWTGRQKFQDGMIAVHKTVYLNSVQHERLEELTFVGPDAAVLRFESTLTGDTRYPGKTIYSRKILVLTKRDGSWRIGWGQNTRFADKPPANQ